MSSSTPPAAAPLQVTSRPSLLRAISSTSSITKSRLSPISKKDKPRLYLALYARGAPNTSSASNTIFNASLTCSAYHWAWITGPQTASRQDPGTCYQILHSSDRSFYEETDLSTQTPSQSATLLCRITLAKVLDEEKLRQTLRRLSTSSHSHSSTVSYPSDSETDHERAARCHEGACTANPDHGYNNDREHDHYHNHNGNNCLQWIRRTYLTLFSPANATNSTPSSKILKTYMTTNDWGELEETARKYAKKKRNQGRFHYLGIGLNRGPLGGGGGGGGGGHPNGIGEWEDNEIATWNFWERRETTG